MARRELLNTDERRILFGVSTDRDALARHYTFGPADLNLIEARRRSGNRLGFAVQLALVRHPGFGLALASDLPPAFVSYVAGQIGEPASAFDTYARRSQTLTDHARDIAATLGLRTPTVADLSLMIEAGAQAAWSTDSGLAIATGIIDTLRGERIMLPAPAVIERTGLAGRARARKRIAHTLISGLTAEQRARLDALLVVDPDRGVTPLAWAKAIPTAPKADHVRELIEKLIFVRSFAIDPGAGSTIHPDRLRQLMREGRASSAYLLDRYSSHRRHAILVALLLDLEARLTDAALDMADRLIGGAFTRARNTQDRNYAATGKDVGRLMRLFRGTLDALSEAADNDADAMEVLDRQVGWAKLMRARAEVAAIAELAGQDPLVRAADRWTTLRKFAPLLLEVLEFKATRAGDPTIKALQLLREMNRTGRRQIPADAPMPFRKDWRALVSADGKIDRRLYETGIFAHLRNKLRSGDVWVERSGNYRRFDSYLVSTEAAAPIAAELQLPATAAEWLETRGRELDWRLRRFWHRLSRGKLDGVELRDGKLHIAPVRAMTPQEADTIAGRLDGLLPAARITEVLHEVSRETGFASAFTNLRTGEPCSNENALFAAVLADATNLGLSRMADASQGVTRDQLVWTADAFIREETYRAALAKIVDAQHRLPIASVWGDGTTSSSDGQFFRSGKRGSGAGEVNAKYGVDPGFSFYTHVSDQHGPYHVTVISAATHEAPYVLDGLLHHGSSLAIAEHYTDTGGATDHVFALCSLLGFRFCPRLRDFPDRRLASIGPASAYPGLAPLMGKRIRADVITEHWDDVLRLVASLKTGTVAPSTMLKKLAAYERQNQLDLALQEIGRVERTLFMLDWLEMPELRRRCHAGLNKGEQRHALAQAICTFRQGRIADRSHEAQQFRASGLNLVIAAIVYWNSTYMADAVAHIRTSGDSVPDHLLAHTSPVGWEHIAFSGDFLWDRAAALPPGRRSLNFAGRRRAA